MWFIDCSLPESCIIVCCQSLQWAGSHWWEFYSSHVKDPLRVLINSENLTFYKNLLIRASESQLTPLLRISSFSDTLGEELWMRTFDTSSILCWEANSCLKEKNKR